MIGRYDFKGDEWNLISEEAKDLIKKILVLNPKDRIKLEEIKKHPVYVNGQNIFMNISFVRP